MQNNMLDGETKEETLYLTVSSSKVGCPHFQAKVLSSVIICLSKFLLHHIIYGHLFVRKVACEVWCRLLIISLFPDKKPVLILKWSAA